MSNLYVSYFFIFISFTFYPPAQLIWQNPLPTGAAINSIFFINVNTVGKEVRVILDEIREPGIYDIALNADGLASGVYFYQMRTGKYSAVKKLNVAK